MGSAKRFGKLRGRIIEIYGTMGRFADEIGMTPTGLSIKLSRGHFTTEQIKVWSEKLRIPNTEIYDFFLI